jgi:drug/metabolite transporter (DMT)-like permease
MNQTQIIGVALFVAGAVLLWLAYGASDSPMDRLSVAIAGEHTDRTIEYLVSGAAVAAAGALMAVFGKGKT